MACNSHVQFFVCFFFKWPPQTNRQLFWQLRDLLLSPECRFASTLRILTPPMETPDPPSDTPGASKQVVLTPHDIPRILRVHNFVHGFGLVVSSANSKIQQTSHGFSQPLTLEETCFRGMKNERRRGPY